MAARRKTSFYHTRNKIAPNKEQAAELLGVTVTEIDRMDTNGAPIMAERLLLLWDSKRIAIPGWDGWLFSRGTLRYKGQQWRPDNILAARFEVERNHRLESQLKQLHSWKGLLKIASHLLNTS